MEHFTTLGKDGLKAAYSALSDFALYLTVALVAILLVAYAIIKFKHKDRLPRFKTLALGIVVGYAVTITAVISLFMVARMKLKGELDLNFYLMFSLCVLCLIYAVCAALLSANEKAFKICNIVGISLLLVYAFIMLFVLPTVDEAYRPLNGGTGMYVLTALLVIIATLAAIFCKSPKTNSTKSLAYAGVCIALSFALSYVKLFSLPQGGSVTLASALPLIIYAYVFGVRKGLLACVVYGLLQFIQSPSIYQPMQVLIDYPIAFGMIGLAGISANIKFTENSVVKFIIGASIGLVGRYFAHIISGYYVFSSWKMDGYSALGWSFAYNLYVIADLAIVLIVGCILFSSKAFNKELSKLNLDK